MCSARLIDNEEELYERILKNKFLVPEGRLYDFGYPTCGNDGYLKYKKMYSGCLAEDYASMRAITCARCKQLFRVDLKTGFPEMYRWECRSHPRGILNGKFLCCGKDDPARILQCCSNTYHVHNGEQLMVTFTGFYETRSKPEREPNKHGIYPLDCEMCYTTMGKELTRVTILDHNLEVVYDKLVKPKNPIVDYNTEFSGIKPGDLDNVTTTLEDVQRDLLKLFSSKSILVGHSLEHDMLALKLIHRRFIDTSRLYEHPNDPQYRYSLAELAKTVLGRTIQMSSGHDSKEDADAAFRLVLKELNAMS